MLAMNCQGYGIFIHTVFQGPVLGVRGNSPDDAADAPERVWVFPTELEAQRETVDPIMTRL